MKDFILNPDLYLFGIWTRGIALDFHSKSPTEKTPLGQLVYQFKYCNNRNVINELSNIITTRLDILMSEKVIFTIDGCSVPFFEHIDAIIAIPPSDLNRSYQPVLELADHFSNSLNIPINRNTLRKIKSTDELKSITDKAQRHEILKDAFSVADEAIKGMSILLFDDLYRSGATLHWASWVLYTLGGARRIYTLVLTKTTFKR